MASFGRFFLPGPTEVRAEVLRAMTRPLIGHRGPEFKELFVRLQDGLRYVFRTGRPVYVSTSSATGMMEAGVRCAPSGTMLALVNGSFSARFAGIARLTGRDCDTYEVPAGEAHDPDELRRRLRARRYALMTVVHCETSTGALNDVRALCAVARDEGVVSVVDSVSGVGGAPFDFDAWGIDFALTGSQKALALPPGLAFAVATTEFAAQAANAPGRGMYFDLGEFEAMCARGETPNTPAVSLLYALDVQLAAIREEGLENRWKRHSAMREATERWVQQMADRKGVALRIAVRPPHRSPTVTTVQLPAELSGSRLIGEMADRGYTLGSGYRALGDTSFRVGHMGDHTVRGLKRCLSVCEEVILELSS